MRPVEEEDLLHKRGEILLVEAGDFMYLAQVTGDTQINDPDVTVKFFVEEIRKAVGNKVSINDIITTREKPQKGWGTQEVLLDYFNGEEWIFKKDVQVFEDYYMLPETVKGQREVGFDKVRIPIPIIHGGKD